jgi:hypothetical protein
MAQSTTGKQTARNHQVASPHDPILSRGSMIDERRSRLSSNEAIHQGRRRLRRDVVEMLYWALRWHEGRRVSNRALSDVLLGDLAQKPQVPAASHRELIAHVQKRHGDDWEFQDCEGKAFRILPRREAPSSSGNCRGGPGRARMTVAGWGAGGIREAGKR